MAKVKDSIKIIAAVIALFGIVLIISTLRSSEAIPDQITMFTTIFLGIFIEAAPFLLLGTLVSGLVEVFFSKEQLQRLVPKNIILGAMFGSVMGIFFPVCECGVVPLTRRLFNKGLPPSVGIAFLLSSPIINPIVIASTFTAYGWSNMLWMRIGFALMISMIVGLIFSIQSKPEQLVKLEDITTIEADNCQVCAMVSHANTPLSTKLRSVLQITADEFFEMGRFLIIGAVLAALMQTFIPQSALLSLGSGPLSSVLVMIVLAVVLSICSTVDAFVSLAFVGTFSSGSILAFLVFGPMVDIKSALMFLQVFRKRTVAYLILLPFLLTTLIAVTINYFFPF